jgi:hypothetical protein
MTPCPLEKRLPERRIQLIGFGVQESIDKSQPFSLIGLGQINENVAINSLKLAQNLAQGMRPAVPAVREFIRPERAYNQKAAPGQTTAEMK